ncbi:MAG: uroporphyrinogen decarboxylase family protein [Thermomicrobiales bacterium]
MPQRETIRKVARPRIPAMTRTERILAALNGDPVDRIPVCFWHHFQPNGSGREMADATLRFFDEEFDLDIAKVMPDLPYPFPEHSITDVTQWHLIEPLSIDGRLLTQRVEAVRDLRAELGDDTPIVMTVFSPLAQLMYFAKNRETFLAHLHQAPVVIHEALATVAENLRDHLRDVISAGADGIFFSIQGASTAVMPAEAYREFGRPYDLMALQGAAGGWLNILHIHGDRDLLFDRVLDYPVQVLSWSDRLAGPSLREARLLTNKCLMGGWHEFGALSNGPAEAIRAEAEDAIAQTGGRRFILANGCSVPDDTDHRWLDAARGFAEALNVPS